MRRTGPCSPTTSPRTIPTTAASVGPGPRSSSRARPTTSGRSSACTSASSAAILPVENGWFVGEKQGVREFVEITAYPAAGGRRRLEFRLSFEAIGAPVEIAGREKKGYGGFGVRFAPRTDTVLRTEAGVEAKDSDMVPHPWAELEAVFAGRRAGLRVEDDPANPGAGPVGWCLRHYGYVAANYPGLSSVTLTPGNPLRLSYRVTVFSAT